jgi:hypothetical protein
MKNQVLIPNKIIITGGLPRSGKTIIRNALGSHSQVAFAPSGFNFFYYFSKENYNKRGGFSENLDFFFNDCWKSKSWSLTRDMVGNTGINRRDLYLTILETYRKNFFPGKKYIGEYTHLSEEYFDTLVSWFGLEKLRFIQIIRNPFDNYASYVVARNVSGKERKPNHAGSFVHKFCNMWSQSTTMAMYRALKYTKSCRTIFFDELTVDPMCTISSLCDWLDIPIELEHMLKMNDFSRKQNSAFKVNTQDNGNGFIQKDSYDRRSILSEYELETIRAMCCPNMLHTMEYEQQNVVINWKFYRHRINPEEMFTKLELMIRSFLSPLSFRQLLLVYGKLVFSIIREFITTIGRHFSNRLY